MQYNNEFSRHFTPPQDNIPQGSANFMALPHFKEGTLYIDRDKDVRNGTWGPYVKIGIVKDAKTPEERIKQLQTGNPRKVHTVRRYFSPMVENLETRLHHNFAEHWVRGEWFEMSEEFVENELHKAITQYIVEQEANIENHKKRVELESVASDGTIREPVQEELDLHKKYIEVKTRSDISNAKSQIIKGQIMDELGEKGGVKGIVQLTKSISPEKFSEASQKFDKKKFKEKYPDLYDKYVVKTQSKPKGNLMMKKVPALKDVNEQLRQQELESENKCKDQKMKLYQSEHGEEQTETLKKLHLEYISLLGEIFDTDLEMERIKSRFAALLGDNEGIKDIITWKRESKSQEKLDAKIIQEKESEAYNHCIVEVPEKTTPEKIKVSIKVEMCREYPV